jgi:ribosomal protein S18 acetylase RimI-like enzyme
MDRNLQALADDNFVESFREHARWQGDQCECVEEDGLLLLAGSSRYPFPYQNCLIRLDAAISAQQVLVRARDFFGSRGRGFLVIVHTGHDEDLDSLCQTSGLKLRANTPCMLIDEPFQSIDLPESLRVEGFKDERYVRDAIGVNSQAYQVFGAPPDAIEATYGNPSRLLSSGNVAGYVLYQGDRPVATALTIFSGKGAGIYWVGTVPDAQRSGLATICTQLATNAGFQHGASAVTLQASPYGEPVYLRLGYKIYDRVKWYSHGKPR